MRKKHFLFLSAFMLASLIFGQETIRMNAIKANDYGIVYALPKTTLILSFKIKKTTSKRGDFYQYAQRYLGIQNAITKDKIRYQMEDVSVSNKGIPDKNNSFMVEFRSNTLEPYVYLTKDGLICSINTTPELPSATNREEAKTSEKTVDPRRFFSEETLMAGSSIKQAELVSKQILNLRQSRNDILTGEAETMPPDGEAYKVVMNNINTQEKALTEMFTGSTQTEISTVNITFVPSENNVDRLIIARFSEKMGIVDSTNLAGAPIYLSLTDQTPPNQADLTERELKKIENKLKTGLVYNIPGKANLKIEYNNQTIKNIEEDIVQFGSKDVLTKKMFDNLKQPIKVIFYPELGAIKQIIQ